MLCKYSTFPQKGQKNLKKCAPLTIFLNSDPQGYIGFSLDVAGVEGILVAVRVGQMLVVAGGEVVVAREVLLSTHIGIIMWL